MAEIIAHEAFDPRARLAFVSHQLGGPFLNLVIEHVSVPFVLDVRDRTQARKEFLRFVQTPAIGRRALDERRIGQRRNRA